MERPFGIEWPFVRLRIYPRRLSAVKVFDSGHSRAEPDSTPHSLLAFCFRGGNCRRRSVTALCNLVAHVRGSDTI
jgi:hypothetical protein